MARKLRPFAGSAACLAMLSMSAVPAGAAELPALGPLSAQAYDGDVENADRWRRRHRDGGIDAGDVIAGVLVLGGIAAIASAASRDRDRDRYRDEPYPDRRYPNDVQYRTGNWQGSGLDSAVDMCVDQVERGRDRVDSVDHASRDASGWNVSGALSDGAFFECRIDNDGRIREVDVGAGGTDYSGSVSRDGQWSDSDYARARAATRYQAPSDYADPVEYDYGDDPRPAYPGGPLPGEPGYEEAIGG